jgi:aminomethyltransferase
MGRVYVRGRDALALSQWCVTRDLARVQPGEAAYALLCRDDGGILDDVIAYALGADEVLFVFNASNREKDIAQFHAQRNVLALDATLDDRTLATALIGVQGPNAQPLLQHVSQASLGGLAGFSFTRGEVAGRSALIARTGYTGEDGFELLVLAEDAEPVWVALQTLGAVPCGLGARDTLRTEAAMPLYGHEIDEATDPFEARLGWAVNLNKDGFVGQEALAALKRRPPTRRLVGLHVTEGGVPRPGFAILHDGAAVGIVTSGTFSPTLKRSIALGYVPGELAAEGTALAVETRGKAIPAQVVSLPFVPHHSRPRARHP